MATKKIDKFQAYFEYVINEMKNATLNDESKQRLMEVILNYGNDLDSSAYNYFELPKSECDRTSTEHPGKALFQTMMLEDDFENPMTKEDIKLFREFMDYCTENADPLLYFDLDTELCYDKINTYFINEHVHNNGDLSITDETMNDISSLEEIEKLKGLLDSGAINQDQYTLLLNNIIGKEIKASAENKRPEEDKQQSGEKQLTEKKQVTEEKQLTGEKQQARETMTIVTSQGDQEWATKNLAVKHYRSGKPIKQLESAGDLRKIFDEELDQEPRWMYYNMDPATEQTHGLLYLFPMGINLKNTGIDEIIEPEGWRFPTGDEVVQLFTDNGHVLGHDKAYTDEKLLSRVIDLKDEDSRQIRELFSTYPGAVLPKTVDNNGVSTHKFHFTKRYSAWVHTGNESTMGNLIFDADQTKLYEDAGDFVPTVDECWTELEGYMIWDDYFPLSFIRCIKE